MSTSREEFDSRAQHCILLFHRLLAAATSYEYEQTENELNQSLSYFAGWIEDSREAAHPVLEWVVSPTREHASRLSEHEIRLAFQIGFFIYKSKHSQYLATLQNSGADSALRQNHREQCETWRSRVRQMEQSSEHASRFSRSIMRIQKLLQAGRQPNEASDDSFGIYLELLGLLRTDPSDRQMSEFMQALSPEQVSQVSKLIAIDEEKLNRDIKKMGEHSVFSFLFGDAREEREEARAELYKLNRVQAFLQSRQDRRAPSTAVRANGNIEEQLAAIIGLDNVKEFVRSLQAQIYIQNERKKLGLPKLPSQTLHMVFRGNPGTGKTTVARIIGDMLFQLGVIQSNKVIETDRSGLVAGYVGQTAIQTRQTIESALDGILFVDEAYTLANDAGASHGFGQEAIDTLVKCMEDYRDRLVVILAGYSREMDVFLNTNPGLASRFPNIVDFTDFTIQELTQIAMRLFTDNAFELSPEAVNKLQQMLSVMRNKPNFGNARDVRNMFELTVRNQALRLQRNYTAASREILIRIEADDIQI